MGTMQDGEASVRWHDQEIAIGKTDLSKNADAMLPAFSFASSVGRASDYCAGGLGFEPQTGPTLRVLK